MTERSEIHYRENHKHPGWWEKAPNGNRDHQHISDGSVKKFLGGGFSSAEMEKEIARCVEAFATCEECWRRWKQGHNSILREEMAVIGHGSVEHGG